MTLVETWRRRVASALAPALWLEPKAARLARNRVISGLRSRWMGTLEPLRPFGRVLRPSRKHRALMDLSIGALRALVLEHRVLVIRGYEPLAPAELVDYCRRWGELLEWDFGFMLDVVEHPNPTNYIFTTSSVPFHWDGAFLKQAPSFQFFQCLKTGDASDGGETLFADTIAIAADAGAGARVRWRDIRIAYAMEKVAHYGGLITAPLIGRHPVLDRETLRFSEPLRDDTVKLNELELEVHGIPQDRVNELFAELRALLYDPRYCYAHSWQAGDILIADNHALLHGRNKYSAGQRRHLQRVQIL